MTVFPGGYNSPNFNIPVKPLVDISSIKNPTGADIQKAITPIYTMLNSIVQNLVLSAGIAPRQATLLPLSNNDTTAILANNIHRFYTTATENIAYGAPISFINSSGTLEVRNACAADNTRPAHGFCSQHLGIATGIVGEVIICEGVVQNLSGITDGSIYYLDAASLGNYTLTAPSGGTKVVQPIAYGLTSTALYFRAFGGLL
jgi:hypothetical protein